MIKNKKRGIVALLIMLCVTLLCAVGCSTIELPDNTTNSGDKQLDAVTQASISINVTDVAFTVSWQAVTNATSYEVECGGKKVEIEATAVNLRAVAGFSIPDSGTVTVSITAKAPGYKSSAPMSKSYFMGSPKLDPVEYESIDIAVTGSAFVVSWTAVPNAEKYEVSCGTSKTTVTGTTVDLRKVPGFNVPTQGIVLITIVAKADGYNDSEPMGQAYIYESNNDRQLSAVAASGISISATATTFVVTWQKVSNAQIYEVACGASKTTVGVASVDLRAVDGFVLPTSGTVTITITAKASGYKDSTPTSKSYTFSSTVTQLAAVAQSGITINKTATQFVVSWTAVTNATSYEVACGASKTTVSGTTVDLRQVSGFNLPESGKITITITAKASGYTDSAPTSKTYYMEGAQLGSPEITAYDNDVIQWKRESEVTAYVVKVNGVKVAESDANTYNTAAIAQTSRIDIIAKKGSAESAATSVSLNATTKKLTMLPVSDYTLDGDILKWGEIGGAIGYKVVDLDYNAYTVSTTHYIMSIRNIVYGVYPVMPASSVVASAEIAPVDIPYLTGSGTAADPYLIKTPFDLRAIDYYELRYSETASASKNNYKINADMDYNSVSMLEADSNVFTLRKPFYGTLDGNNKTLSNLRVNYNYGFWALFEHIATGATVKNITFDAPEINNGVQDNEHPINPAVATVAYRNYGTVSGVKVKNATYSVTAGAIAGVVVHNYGTVTLCSITSSRFNELNTSGIGSASYEMAGIVLENLNGGNVNNCEAKKLTIVGSGTNVGTTGGIVAVNRAGGSVVGNSFDEITVTGIKSGKECGGVVGYSASTGTVTKGTATLGTISVGGSQVTAETGNTSSPRGKLCGKKA